jgi:hypothetical protein
MINLEIQSSCEEELYKVGLQELCISRLIMDYVMDIPDTVLHHRSSVFQG